MEVITVYYFWIASYVLVILFISGFFVRKSIKSYEEYTVAGRSLGFFFIFFTYFSTWISGAVIIGLATMAFEWGIYQYWFIAVTYIMGAVSGPLFLIRIRKLDLYTIGDFFALRFSDNEKVIRILVALSMISRNITIVGAQFTTMAFFISIGFGVDFNKALYTIAIFIIVYTSMSGLWGVAGTDIMQGLIQIMGIGLLLYNILAFAGGIGGVVDFYQKIDGLSYLNMFEKTNRTTEIFVLLLAPGMFFIIEDQTTWQRIISSKNDKVAFWGYLAPLGAALLWLLVPCFIGVFSKSIFPNFTAYPIALLNFITSLPQWKSILILFAILSACVSTCDSYLLASGTIFSRDIAQGVFNLHEKYLIWITRFGIAVCGFLGLYAATKVYDIFELYMLGAYIGGSILTVPYLLTWFSKAANSAGIIGGMLMGAGSFYLCALYFEFTYPTSMIISMCINLLGSYIISFAGKPPLESSVKGTYYFSPNFSNISNIPK